MHLDFLPSSLHAQNIRKSLMKTFLGSKLWDWWLLLLAPSCSDKHSDAQSTQPSRTIPLSCLMIKRTYLFMLWPGGSVVLKCRRVHQKIARLQVRVPVRHTPGLWVPSPVHVGARVGARVRGNSNWCFSYIVVSLPLPPPLSFPPSKNQ